MAKHTEHQKPAKPKRIIDVAHPGKSLPSATAKPVIVSNRPIMQDPMVGAADTTQESASNAEASAETAAQAHYKELVLQPAASESAPASTAEDQAAEEHDSPQKTTAPPLTLPQEAPDTKDDAKRDVPQSPPETSDTDTVPAKADKATSEPDSVLPSETPSAEPPATPSDKSAEAGDPKKESAATGTQPAKPSPDEADETAAKQKAEHEAAIQKLVDSKQYFLPINAVEKRRTKRFVVIGLLVAIILIIAWIDIALDAGLIHLGGLKPATHFFSG